MKPLKPVSGTSFGLAKGKELLSDDAYAFKNFNDLSIGIIADGVGSARKGREASQRIVDSLLNNFKNRPQSWSVQKSLQTFIENINHVLYAESHVDYEQPEYVSTLAVVVIEGDRLYGANVGDSRIYLLRNGKLEQLSQDHIFDEEEMSHVLTNAIGLFEEVEPYFFKNTIQEGDKILLCSDGLYTLLDNQQLTDCVLLEATTLVQKASRLVQDDLPDDTSATVISINKTDEFAQMKALDLPIPETLKEGMEIDRFVLTTSLIQNQRTWLCTKKGKEFVIKFPPLEAIDDPRILDLFIKEAWNANRLKAGFFAKAFIPEDRTSRYYVMEYEQGNTLKEYTKKKPLHIDDAINLAKFLLKANQFLLRYDLVHGDIKPENIIVSKRDDKLIFKLIDYGSIVEIFSIASRAGTPSYLAPERFGDTAINEQTEIFAIGVTLFEALTQKYPYGEIEPFQTPTFKTPKSLRTYNKMVPAWLESIIMRSIERDAGRRYEVYSEMEYELSNPDKVKPYFKKGATLLEREPILVYRLLFTASFLLNLYLLSVLLK